MMNGILYVDKPRGMTSHDVVAAVRRLTGERAVGHTGTLDPDASGLLLLCVGRATKFAQFFEALDKTYWVVMRLGVVTDTQDATGNVLQRCEVPPLTAKQLEGVCEQFTGQVQQIPPMYSAVKHRGQRLYRLARQGQTVVRRPRQVLIRHLRCLDMRGDLVTLSVTCSKGTYVRTLCEDIGGALGCGAHTVHLQRCKIGTISIAQAYTLDMLQQLVRCGHMARVLTPLARALEFLPMLCVTSQQYQALQMGQGRTFATIRDRLSTLSSQACSYRLHTRLEGTFAIMHRQASNAERWKVSYLERSRTPTREITI
jgi:tRNA pseudouridine55 synthase